MPGTPATLWNAVPLTGVTLPSRLPGGLGALSRVVVVAAHPDDETLGAGGLIAECAALGVPVHIVVVTDGRASHPASPSTTPAALAARREAESRDAAALLAPAASLSFLAFPDGAVSDHHPAIRAALAAEVSPSPGAPATPHAPADPAPATPHAPANPGPASPPAPADPAPAAAQGTLLVAPWRGDGHRDHRLIGELCADLAGQQHLTLLEYPIWLWHWGRPGDTRVPWGDVVSLPLTGATVAAKHAAIRAHRSQVEPLSPAAGDEPVLLPDFLRNFDRPDEVFVLSEHPEPTAPTATGASTAQPTAAPSTTALPGAYFDETYARHDDPWGFTNRWYERRKRAVTIAALPRERYASGLELGCSIGVLTHDLAARTDALLAVDIAEAAVERARERLADSPHVRVERADAAAHFPDGEFDLVILSEVGYYFDAATLARVLQGITDHSTPDTTLVACHWRHPVDDYLQTGDDVHSAIASHAAATGLTRIAHHLEVDFVLDVYCSDPRSVAQSTGLA